MRREDWCEDKLIRNFEPLSAAQRSHRHERINRHVIDEVTHKLLRVEGVEGEDEHLLTHQLANVAHTHTGSSSGETEICQTSSRPCLWRLKRR